MYPKVHGFTFTKSTFLCKIVFFAVLKFFPTFLPPQEEYLTSCYWRTSQQPADIADKYDPSRPYYEIYKVDYDQFKSMFLSLSPWAKGDKGVILALRAFRVRV